MKAALARLAAFMRRHRVGAFAPHVIVSLVFVLSRLAYRVVFGLTFDWRPITYFIQYAPLWILKHDFWRSIFYLHQQAPFQNLLAGGLWVALGPDRAETALDAIYVACGYAFAMAFLSSMRRLGVGAVLATIAVSAYTASPIAVLYEMWLFYHQPVVTCFALALFGLLRFYERPTFGAGVFFFSMLGVAALFRSVYGPLWMLGVLAALLLCPPRAGRRASPAPAPRWRRWVPSASPRTALLAAAVVPIAIVAANGLKTSILLGRGYSSAAIWANVPLKMWPYMSSIDRERLLREKIVSEELNHEAFDNLLSLSRLRVPHQDTGVPLLDMAVTPDHELNYHTLEYLLIIDKYYKPDGEYLLKHYPEAYEESVRDGFASWYCSAPTRDLVLWRAPNTVRLAKMLEALDARGEGAKPTRSLQIALPLLFLYGVYRILRPKAWALSERSRTAATLFMMVTITYAGVGTTLISGADMSRYRFDVDPFYYTLFAWLLTGAGGATRRGARAAVAFLRRKLSHRLGGKTLGGAAPA